MSCLKCFVLALGLALLACGGESSKEDGGSAGGGAAANGSGGGDLKTLSGASGSGDPVRKPPVTPQDPEARLFASIGLKINSPNSDHRVEAISLLAEVRDKRRAGAIVVKLLGDEDEDVRYMAAEALGMLEYAAASEALRKCLREEEESLIRKQALQSLALIMKNRAVSDYIGRLKKDDDASVRAAAATLLGGTGMDAAVDPLLEAMMEDMAHGVRLASVAAVRKLKPARALDPVIEALEDANELVQIEAAKTLGVLGNKKAVPVLIEVLTDEESQDNLLVEATSSLCKLTGEKTLYKTDEPVAERKAALQEWADWWIENEGDY